MWANDADFTAAMRSYMDSLTAQGINLKQVTVEGQTFSLLTNGDQILLNFKEGVLSDVDPGRWSKDSTPEWVDVGGPVDLFIGGDGHAYIAKVDADGNVIAFLNPLGATIDNLDQQWIEVRDGQSTMVWDAQKGWVENPIFTLPELFVHDQLIQLETQTVVEAVPPLWTFNPEGQPARLDTASLNYFQDETSGWVYGLNANGVVEVFGYPKGSDHLEYLKWVVVTDSETSYHNLPVAVGSAMQPGESLNRFSEANELRYSMAYAPTSETINLENETRQLLTPEELALDTGAEVTASAALRAAVVLSEVNGNTPFTLEELLARLDAGETVSLNIPGSDRPWLVNRGVVVIHSAPATLPFGNANNGRNWQGVDASGRWIVMSTCTDLQHDPIAENGYRNHILFDGLFLALQQFMSKEDAGIMSHPVALILYRLTTSPHTVNRLIVTYPFDLTRE